MPIVLDPSDPQNLLSEAARRRIDKAYVSAEAIRTKAEADAEARARVGKRVDEAPDGLERREAELESVRLILGAMLKEYSAAREDAIRAGRISESGWNLREIMARELDGLASSAGLTDIDRHTIELELSVDLRTATEEAISEVVQPAAASPKSRPAKEATPARPEIVTNEHDNRATRWKDVEITFLSDERVQIRNGNQTETQNYAEWGFADRRTGKPNQAWVTLRAMAELNGIIRDGARAGAAWPKVEKRIQEIRKVLRKHFGIAADPIPFIEGTGYQSRLKKIGCSPSFRT